LHFCTMSAKSKNTVCDRVLAFCFLLLNLCNGILYLTFSSPQGDKV
jgi:hypothetical protein